MIQTGDWLLPSLGPETTVFHTPILPYWLAAVGHLILPWKLLGFRLLNILIYLFAFWGFFRLIRKYLDPRTSFYSCCFLACSLPFGWQMQLATPDSLAAILICSSLLGFYLLLKTNNQKYFWLMFGSMTAGILVKGIIALLLPILIMVLYLMFKVKMNETNLKKLSVGKGVLLVVLLGFPWFVYAGIDQDGVWLQEFLDEYHWERYVEETSVAEGAFYLPFLFILFMTLPFGIFLPKSFSYSWKYRFKKDLLLLSALAFLLILFFYAFSATFYPHYLLPAIPFAAILMAYRFNSVSGRSLMKMGMGIETGLLILIAIAVPVFSWYSLSGALEEGFSTLLSFSVLLVVVPLGVAICLLFWKYKRTDEGICILTFSYLLFYLLLIHFSSLANSMADSIQYLIY